MPVESSAARLAAARLEVRRACELLVEASPEALERCQGALEHAVSELGEFQSKCSAVTEIATARSTAHGLRAEVRRAAGLLQSLADFHHGWARILGAMSLGYTSTGDPATVGRQGRLYCRG
jgi:hypothetical protein